MLDCDNCGRPVDGDSCAVCGYGKAAKPTIAPQVMAARQAYLDSAPKPETRMSVDEMRAECKRLMRSIGRTEGRHPRAWAHRILERVDRGESLPRYSIECALEVVGPV
jgi:hypothetical protein